jgi:hypothetical protein
MTSSPPRLRIGLSVAIALAPIACGGSPAPVKTEPLATSPHDPAPGDAHEHGSERKSQHEHLFSGDLKLYHDLMSPLWHAEAGGQRISDVCNEAATLKVHARAVAESPPPAGSEGEVSTWSAAASQLSEKTDALAAACDEQGRANVEAAFTAVHEAFHALMRATGKPSGDHH